MPKAMVVEMTKKIFRSVFLASASVLLASLVLIIGVLYGYFDSMQQSRLKSELVLASAGTEKGGKDYLGSIGTTDCRLTLVDRDGTVLFDSMNDASEMQNHAEAPEIKAAFEYGDGESERGRAMRKAICAKLRFATLEFQTLPNLIKAIGLPEHCLCTYCWSGKE